MTSSRVSLQQQAELLAQLPELAATCEQQVERALGFPLAGELETLPILDHYIKSSRAALEARPELLPVLERTIGAYFGRLLVDHFDGSWQLVGPDVHSWFVTLRQVYLALNPVGVVRQALTWGLRPELSEGGPAPELILARDDRERVETRLALLPPMREEDFYTLSTRVETLEIAVAVLREAEGLPALELGDPDETDDADLTDPTEVAEAVTASTIGAVNGAADHPPLLLPRYEAADYQEDLVRAAYG
jgi:hypothetical protein